MKDKIKEILERFNEGHDKLTVEEYILLENYITNLQKENKHLKDLYNQALKDYDELLEKE